LEKERLEFLNTSNNVVIDRVMYSIFNIRLIDVEYKKEKLKKLFYRFTIRFYNKILALLQGTIRTPEIIILLLNKQDRATRKKKKTYELYPTYYYCN
jgi:hypothetical protein